MNRNQRIRSISRRYAIAFQLEEVLRYDAHGNIVRDEKGIPVGTGEFFKTPVTAELSWIKPHIRHSKNNQRMAESISTFRRSVYGAPLRDLHHKSKYLEWMPQASVQ